MRIIKLKKAPTHLGCPFCPAQAYPVNPNGWNRGYEDRLIAYLCPANHVFYIKVPSE